MASRRALPGRRPGPQPRETAPYRACILEIHTCGLELGFLLAVSVLGLRLTLKNRPSPRKPVSAEHSGRPQHIAERDGTVSPLADPGLRFLQLLQTEKLGSLGLSEKGVETLGVQGTGPQSWPLSGLLPASPAPPSGARPFRGFPLPAPPDLRGAAPQGDETRRETHPSCLRPGLRWAPGPARPRSQPGPGEAAQPRPGVRERT